MKYGILEGKPKSLSRAKYLMIESILEGISRRTGINLGELDLYLWYIETGKVLK
jgi:N-glycosylase/DNA lyase